MKQDEAARAERIRALATEIRGMSTEPPLVGSGRGLVIAAGGARLFTNAYVLVHMLRHALGCSLPIELWHFGPSEISPAMAAVIEPLGVRLVDATPIVAAEGAAIRDGWQLKSFAIVHSRFAEVLLLDADQVPICDPAACFDWPQYRESGAVFWPDIIDLRGDNGIWALLGLEPGRRPSLESGQLLVDRRRHGAPLRAALRLNEAADDVYQLIYGDKDTYLLAWQMLGATKSLVPHQPYADEFLLVQRDFGGNAFFQHRTNAKWQYGKEQRKLFGFKHEEACLAALAELEQRWTGRVFAAPDRNSAARQFEAQVMAANPFRLEAIGEPPISLVLEPYAEISEGRAADRRHWWIEQDGEGMRLVLSGGELRSYVLERRPDGIWRGLRHRPPTVEVDLIPTSGDNEPILRPELPGLVDELLRASGLLDGALDGRPALSEALVLLGRVVPGTRERLLHLAKTQADSAIAAQLRAVAERLAPPVHRDVDRTFRLELGYIRAEIPE